MGIFDKLLGRKGRSQNEEEQKEEQPVIILDIRDMEDWPDKLIAHFDLRKQFKEFLENTEKIKKKVTESLKPFKEESVISGIPERARTVSALHGTEFADQSARLVGKASFTDLFSFDDEHAEFLEGLDEFRSRTKKNASALEEFLGKNLKQTNQNIQDLEDEIIRFMSILEKAKFHYIKQMHNAYRRLEDLEVQREKYQQLKESLTDDLERTRDKRAKIEEEIKKQSNLIRNEQSQEALGKLKELEEDFDKILNQYETCAKDALRYYQRYAEDISLDKDVKAQLEGIVSDPASWLEGQAGETLHALRHAADQIDSEGRGNVSNLVQRLLELANSAEVNGEKARDILPKQRELKKEIIRDVAALSIYDQQQFLIRANREETSIQNKLDFLEEELSPGKRLVIEREVKDSAINLGAKITGQTEEETQEETKEELEETQEEDVSSEELDSADNLEEELEEDHDEPEEVPEEEPVEDPEKEEKLSSEIEDDPKEADEDSKKNPPDVK